MGQGEYSGQKRKLPGESCEKTYPKRRVTTLLCIVRQVRICVVCALASTKMTLIAKLDLCWLTMTGFSETKTAVSGAMSSV